MEKDKRKNYSKILLIVGTLLMIIAPIIFTYLFKINISESAEIGETIGGITSPVVSLIGAILLYYALSAQIDSNKLLAEQIEEDRVKERKQNEEEHISQLYQFFSKNIEEYTYELKNTDGSLSNIFKGSIALHYFVEFIQKENINPHNTEELLQDRNVREFVSIIESSKLMIDSLQESIIDTEDKVYYKNLISHQLTYKISPNFDSISKYGK
uniref:hypothetical protein n=1 Tax=Gelidibacter japonicus TaxID=1962232 RepID=UPI003A8DDA50